MNYKKIDTGYQNGTNGFKPTYIFDPDKFKKIDLTDIKPDFSGLESKTMDWNDTIEVKAKAQENKKIQFKPIKAPFNKKDEGKKNEK